MDIVIIIISPVFVFFVCFRYAYYRWRKEKTKETKQMKNIFEYNNNYPDYEYELKELIDKLTRINNELINML